MSLRRETPCDHDGICPYAYMHSGYMNSCEYWCGAEEPEDYEYEAMDDYYSEIFEESDGYGCAAGY